MQGSNQHKTRNIIVFAGTTEGRILSDRLCESGITHLVSVASGCGSEMLGEHESRTVLTGRMDEEEIIACLKQHGFHEGDFLADATHPYATGVTKNLQRAAERTGVTYLRIARKSMDVGDHDVRLYETISTCAKSVNLLSGNILLATGSKELEQFCAEVSEDTIGRTYVRVLPTEESIAACKRCGIDIAHILALQGPFTEELNTALLRQYRIAHMITKESGTEGGFPEKTKAARKAGVMLHVLTRPADPAGVTLEQAYRTLSGTERNDGIRRRVSLIGIGMGTEATLTVEAKELLAKAEALFGAPRLLPEQDFRQIFPFYRPEEIIPVLEEHPEWKEIAILFSGDSGFFSGARSMHAALKERMPELTVQLIPGINSVAFLAARLGESYEDAAIVSLHGRNTPGQRGVLLEKIRRHRKTFVLAASTEEARELVRQMKENGIRAEVLMGCDLSYENERIITVDTDGDEWPEMPEETTLLTLLVKNADPKSRLLLPVLPDKAFIRGNVPMTKACIRHESIRRLQLKEGERLYDIGGGTGSVTIETALLHPSLQVFSVEQNREACALIRENCKRHRCTNVTVVEGAAPEALTGLPAPDAVFLGGTGGRLREILSALGKMRSGIRIVMNMVTPETMTEWMELQREISVQEEEMVQLTVSTFQRVGEHSMPHTDNPVTIVSFVLEGSAPA
ncbi:MAG: precorrin-6A reductase [Lachnospiraceae bacterium]|nr:precorrin-6A reductase [Lachnospiraceae bacterium]